jgi:hypothetical protein
MRAKRGGRTGHKSLGRTGRVTGVFGLGEEAEVRLAGKSWPETYSQQTESARNGVFSFSPDHVTPMGKLFTSSGEVS